MRHDHHPGSGIDAMPDRRQRGLDTLITGNHTIAERNVQVLADQYALTGQVEAGHFQYWH